MALPHWARAQGGTGLTDQLWWPLFLCSPICHHAVWCSGSFPPKVDLLLHIASCLPKSILRLYSVRVLAELHDGQTRGTFPSLPFNRVLANGLWVEELGEFPWIVTCPLLLSCTSLELECRLDGNLFQAHRQEQLSVVMAEAMRWKEHGVLNDPDEQSCPTASQGHPFHITSSAYTEALIWGK